MKRCFSVLTLALLLGAASSANAFFLFRLAPTLESARGNATGAEEPRKRLGSGTSQGLYQGRQRGPNHGQTNPGGNGGCGLGGCGKPGGFSQ